MIRQYADSEDEEMEHNMAQLKSIGKTIKPKDFNHWNLFMGFVQKHKKVYKSKKDALHRFKVYKRNMKSVKLWQENERGTAVYGETQFMDLTSQEFKQVSIK